MQATMTAPISFTHSPFLYHHVPNSPFLLPPRPQVTQSPAPFVPDIDNPRENRQSTGGLLYSGKKKLLLVACLIMQYVQSNFSC